MKLWQRATAVFVTAVMVLCAVPFCSASITMSTPVTEIMRDYTVGKQLDYNVLFDTALVVVSGAGESDTVSYIYRGKAISEQYSATRHFATLSDALAYADGNASVFYLTAANYSGSYTFPAGSVILGANAGVSPNGQINFELPNVTKGWDSASRFDETKLLASVVSDGSLVIDGISFISEDSLFRSVDADPTSRTEFKITVQNSLISGIGKTSTIFDTSASYSDGYGYDIKDSRITNTACSSTFCKNTYAIHTDGVYFYGNSGTFINCNTGFAEYNFSLDLYRTYMYKNTSTNYNLNVSYTSGDHKSSIVLDQFLWYESTGMHWGIMRFYSTYNSKFSSYNVTIINSTCVADKSFNKDTQSNTFLNGNSGYQEGPYTIKVNNNRIIGFKSMFANVANQDMTRRVHADYNNNYFAPTFTSVTDVKGTRSEYSNFKTATSNDFNNIDYARLDLINYYSDYAMTLSTTTFNVKGVNFYDSIDYISIDNKNANLSVGMREGTVTSPEVFFEGDAVTSVVYTDSACTNVCTSFGAPARGAVATYYVKASCGGTEKTIQLKVYGEEAVPYFSSSYSDPTGVVKKTAYYLCPQGVSGDIEVEFDGSRYLFTVGKNAFSSVDKILAATSGTPQIILPCGNYGDITVNESCEIYGQNRRSPVKSSIESECIDGIDWISGKSATISNLHIKSNDVTVSGVTVSGTLTVGANISTSVSNSKLAGILLGGGTGTLSVVGCEAISDTLLSGRLSSSVSVESCYFPDGAVLGDATWGGESYDKPCNISVVGCRFDGVDKTVISDFRSGDVTEADNINVSLLYNVFDVEDATDAAVSLKTTAYNSLEIRDNRFVNKTDSGAPIYFDNATGSGNVQFYKNRFIGFKEIATADDHYLVNGSFNYFAKYRDDYQNASDGTAIPGNINCSDYYIDYQMTQALPTVVGYSFSDKITVRDRNLVFTALGDTSDLSSHIIAECGLVIYDSDGNECDIKRLESKYNLTAYTVVFYNKVSPSNRNEYQLLLVKDVPNGCNIVSVTSDYGTVKLENDGSYRMTVPASVENAKVTVTTDGGSAKLVYDGHEMQSVSDLKEGQTREYTIVVTHNSTSVLYRLVVTRQLSSGVIVDYDAVLDTAYIIGATKNNGRISFFYRGKTVELNYDSARHFDTFEAAYNAYLATNPQVITDTPVFIFAPGNYSGITVKYRAIILGANAGIKPQNKIASGSEPFSLPSLSGERSTENATVFTDAIYRPAVDSVIENAETQADARFEHYLVVDGIDVNTNKVFLTENTQRLHKIVFQNVISNAPLASGGSGGEVVLKNVTAGGISTPVVSAVTDKLTVDDSYINNVSGEAFSGFSESFVITNSFIDRCAQIKADVEGALTVENSIINDSALSVEGASAVSIVGNTFTGRYAPAVAAGVSATVENNRFFGFATVNIENIGINYLAPQFVSDADLLGSALGKDWYIDYKMTVKRSDFNIADINFGDNINEVNVDNSIPFANVVLTNDVPDTPTVIPYGNNVAVKITLGGISVTQIEGGKDYVISLSKGGYTVDVPLLVKYERAYVFADGEGDGIIQNTAVMIVPGIIADDGEGKIVNWRGKKYIFVYGENLFDSFYGARASRTGHMQMMVGACDITDEVIIPADTSIYGVNFDINPSVMSESLGDDWLRNPEWGKYGQTEMNNVSVPQTATGSKVELYGITLRGRIWDGDRLTSDRCTEFNMVNILVEHEDWQDTPYSGTSNMYTITLTNNNSTSGTNNIDRGMIKNMRVEKIRVNKEVSANRNRLLNERLPQQFTVEGLYIDMKKADCSLIGWMKISDYQQNGKLTYKNCNIRNAIEASGTTINLSFEGRNHAAVTSGDNVELTIENCTFYNAQIGKKSVINLALQAYSKITIKNNLLLSTTSQSTNPVTFTSQSTSDLVTFNFKKNRLVGVKNTINLSTGSKKLDLSGNYYASYTANYKSGTSGGALSGTNITCANYYRDYALTSLNTDIAPYAFGNGMVDDRENKTLSLTLDAMDGNTMSLMDYVVSNPSNHTFTVSGVSDISAIPLNEGQNVFTVTVAGKDTYTMTVTLNSSRKKLAELIREVSEVIEKPSFSRYTLESAEALLTAYETACDVYDAEASTDLQIKDAFVALQSAFGALETDTSELVVLVDSCPQNYGQYTSASYAVLNDVLAEVNSCDNFTPETVDDFIARIKDAISKLVDTREYTTALADANAVSASKYSQEVYLAFRERISEIASSASFNTQEDVMRAAAAIRAAHSLLIISYSYYDGTLKNAKEYVADDWTYLSFNALKSAIEQAEAINRDEAWQTQLDAAADGIVEAINALVDAKSFNAALKQAKQLTSGGYEPSSWNKFVSKLMDIERRSKEYTTKEQAEQGANEIALAIAALSLDTSTFNEVLSQAINHPRQGYTSSSLAVLENAIRVARELDKNPTNEQINECINSLKNAMASLVEYAPLAQAVSELEAISNADGKYCPDEFEKFEEKVISLRWSINSVENEQQKTAFLNEVNAAKALAKGHSFTYKNNNDATCNTLATKTGLCVCGKTEVKQIPSSYVPHKCESYRYNNDATYVSDGTKSGSCIWCGSTVTVAAPGTKLTVKPIDSAAKFKDVGAKAWYKAAVDYAVGAGFISGMTNDTFGVSTPITRGMFITILARISGVDTSSTANKTTTKFSDVKSGKYYTAAIKWGVEKGIVTGMSATTFAPESAIQRQQLCVMIVNFAKYQKISLGVAEPAISFSDASTIGNYAKDAVRICQMADIVNGYTEGAKTLFKPKNTATRAEAAQILYKFHSTYAVK